MESGARGFLTHSERFRGGAAPGVSDPGLQSQGNQRLDIEGISIPAGSRIVVPFASANRDERKWEQADTFDVTRNTSGHLGLGYGVHLCAGASLARLEGLAVLGALARRVERFELGTSTRNLNNFIRGLSSLAVTVHATKPS